MPKGNGSSAWYPLIIAATFIILEVAALKLLSASSSLQDIWMNRISHRTLGVLWSSGETLRNHFSLEKENLSLQEANWKLNEELKSYHNIAESALEAAAMTGGFSKRFSYIPASVVKISRNTAHNYIIVNKGSEDGVRPYCGIISENGIVGIIKSVDRHYSYGLTIMNSRLSISSRIGHSGIAAPLVWDGIHSNRGYLKDIPPHYDVAVGDTVYTSGFSSIFPPDVPIGVTGKSEIEDGSSQRTEVILFQNLSALRYVTIVDNPEKKEIFNLEKKEEASK